MAWIVNVFNDSKGNIRSARLLLSASDESDNSTPYLKKQLNKLVVLDENEHWKCVFQEIYGREWICEFDSPSKNQFFALRCCCIILREAICKGIWVNGQQASESHGV